MMSLILTKIIAHKADNEVKKKPKLTHVVADYYTDIYIYGLHIMFTIDKNYSTRRQTMK